jgi:hypothetical protein
MSQVPKHPFLLKHKISQETIEVNLHSSQFMEQQLHDWSNMNTSWDSRVLPHTTNRQQAIMTLLEQESASCNELQELFCHERRLRDTAEQSLISAEIRCQEWASAYTICEDDLSTQLREVQRLKEVIAGLRTSPFTVSPLPTRDRLCMLIATRKKEEQFNWML